MEQRRQQQLGMSKSAIIWSVGALSLLFAIIAIVLWPVALQTAETHPSKGGSPSVGIMPIRINIVTWPGYGPIYLAQEKGFFKQEGITVDVQIQENTQARNAALVSGQIDLIGITFDSIVLADMNGLPMQAVGVSDISNGGDGIIAKKGINSIASLKGKTVAFPEGQPSHMFLLHHLSKTGMRVSDINALFTDDAGKAGEYFVAGKVDAAVTWEPWLSNAVKEGKGMVLVDSKGITDILIGIFAAHQGNTVASTPKFKAFFRAWYKALDYYEKNPEESIQIMARGFGMPSAEFKDILGGLRFIQKNEAEELLGAHGKLPRFRDIAKANSELWYAAGVAKNKTLNLDSTYSAIALD